MYGHARALPRQPQRDAAANALGRPGHQDHFAGQILVLHLSSRSRSRDHHWPLASKGAVFSAGAGRRPVTCAQPQNIAVVELSAPAIVPTVLGSQCWVAIPASVIEI